MVEEEPKQKRAAPSEQAKANQVIGRYGTIGLEIFFAILLGYIFGSYLDKWIGTKPYLTVLLTLYGVIAAIRALLRMTKMYKEDLKTQEKNEQEQ
jgi:ATP synthase protein I